MSEGLIPRKMFWVLNEEFEKPSSGPIVIASYQSAKQIPGASVHKENYPSLYIGE